MRIFTECKLPHTRRERESTRQQVQGTHVPMVRASRCRAREYAGVAVGSTFGFTVQGKNKARHAQQGKVRVRAHKGHAVEAPGEMNLAAPVLRALGYRSCELIPSSTDYAC